MSKQGKTAFWASLAVVLTIFLVVVLTSNGGMGNFYMGKFNFGWISNNAFNEDAKKYIDEYTAQNPINSVDLHFVDEEIIIFDSSDEFFKIEQVGASENRKMNVVERDGNIFAESNNLKLFNFSFTYKPVKVNVYIPKDSTIKLSAITASGNIIDNRIANYAEAKYSSVSGNIDTNIASAQNASYNTTSGNVTVTTNQCSTVELNTISGTLSYSGEAKEKIESNTTSGNTSMNLTNMPEKINVSTVSGDTDISIPDNEGFKLDYDTISGHLDSDFPIASDVYKDNVNKISITSVSGNASITMS